MYLFSYVCPCKAQGVRRGLLYGHLSLFSMQERVMTWVVWVCLYGYYTKQLANCCFYKAMGTIWGRKVVWWKAFAHQLRFYQHHSYHRSSSLFYWNRLVAREWNEKITWGRGCTTLAATVIVIHMDFSHDYCDGDGKEGTESEGKWVWWKDFRLPKQLHPIRASSRPFCCLYLSYFVYTSSHFIGVSLP